MKNYFDILNVSIDAEPEVIKASYRTLAKKYHPDVCTGNKEEAKQKMVQINEAYHVLSDDRLRAEYITKLKAQNNTSNRTSHEKSKERPQHNNSEESEVRRSTTQNRKHSTSNTEDDRFSNFVSRAVILIIMISILCCIIHFGPSILDEFFENLSEQIEELIYSFS